MLESDHWSDNSSGLTSVNASYFFFPESELDCHPAVFWLGAAAMVLILSFFGFFRLPITSLLSFSHASLLRFDDDTVRHAACRFRPGSAFWRNDLLSAYGAIQCVDKRLHLDKFAACTLRLVPVKRSGQHLRMRIPFLDHTRAGFIQRFESLTH